MYIIPIILLGIIIFTYEVIRIKGWKISVITLLVSIMLSASIVGIDYIQQITDTEVWSGYVESVKHKEEYDEIKTEEIKDSKGKVTGHRTYVVHHEAENQIKTTDDGWINVKASQDGSVKFNDRYPNTNEELTQHWKIGTPSASVHTYTNKVQSSYSIYRHDIDLNKYKDLPEYPSKVSNYIDIDRIIGDVPNKDSALDKLAAENMKLNKSVPDLDKPGKTRSYKQVNIIFVNVGDKPEEYGFALQDKWENGNKNDFVVSFSTDSQGNIKWVYPFSWSEVELLKLEVRDYMINLKQINDFVPVVENVSKMVESKFERKQFADFNYLQIEVSKGATIFMWVINVFVGVGAAMFIQSEYGSRSRRRRYSRY